MRRGLIALILVVSSTSACGALSTANKVRNIANGKTAKQLEKVEKQIEAGQKLVYTADYDSRDTAGKVEKIHVAQKPPKSVYSSGDNAFIDNGTDSFTCTPDTSSNGSGSGGKPTIQCLKTPGSSGTPIGFVQAVNGSGVLVALSAAAIIPGVNAKNSSRNIAGEKLDCVEITVDKKRTEYCITKDGILGFVDNGDGSRLELTSFKRSASDGEFKPTGKVVTEDDLLNQSTTTTTRPGRSTTTTTAPDTSDTTDTTDTTVP